MLHVGCEGTGAVMILVIAFAGVDVDEVVLDGAFNPARHVVIDGGKAGRHAYGLVFAELRTIGTLHIGVVEVDAEDVYPVLWRVAAEDAMETMLTEGADGAVAYLIVFRFFGKDLFSA